MSRLVTAGLVAGLALFAYGTHRLRAAESAGGPAAAPRPVLDFAAAGPLRAFGPATAADALVRTVADRASAAGLRVVTVPAGRASSAGFVALELSASGPAVTLRRFAATLEQGRPSIRLAGWSLMPAPDGVRLRARAVAAWRP